MRVCFASRQAKCKNNHGADREDCMTISRLVEKSRPSRRSLLKSAALGSTAALTAPYVRGAYFAGSLSLGVRDHWVPGANDTFTAVCNESAAQNHVEVKIDYITTQGDKDKLTAAAEAQAGTGHDVMSHRDWNIRIHQNGLDARRHQCRAYQTIRPDQPGVSISAGLKALGARYRRRGDARSNRPARVSACTSNMLASTSPNCSRPTNRNGTRRRPILDLG